MCNHLHVFKVFSDFLEIKYILEMVSPIFTFFYHNHKLIFFIRFSEAGDKQGMGEISIY